MFSYSGIFGDGHLNFDPWSSDEDAPEIAPSSPNYHTNGRTFELSTDLTCIAPLHGGSFSGTELELVVLGQLRCRPQHLIIVQDDEVCRQKPSYS
ncbi:hypothetical protein TNCV_1173211 [Trichonephila clavipes]|uniref:Uncharacterized protein n=1 Tax=Trichonephila clavipes TaxID=2585209 RepID=A0A8X6SAB4_TRICX|nr:hypothetical protein TNCV_1173211 [Trichonephila clavipes]